MRPRHAPDLHNSLMRAIVADTRAPDELALIVKRTGHPAGSLGRSNDGNTTTSSPEPESIEFWLQSETRRARIRDSTGFVDDDNPFTFPVNLLDCRTDLILGMGCLVVDYQPEPCGFWFAVVGHDAADVPGYFPYRPGPAGIKQRVVAFVVDDEYLIVYAQRKKPVDDKVRFPAAVLAHNGMMRGQFGVPQGIDPPHDHIP